ncbi:MAG: type II toxin-antitoxin system VapC family toxin [bacterium]|nr:type II toxin-antitoxin system VapC family toxin [bacterium]
MSTFFVDTSALAKRYLIETGSTWTRQLMLPASGNVIIISDLTPVEFFSLLLRRQRAGNVSSTRMSVLQSGFLAHLTTDYLSVPLEEPVLTQARDLVLKYVLRPPDALQLASALHAVNILGETITFVCADNDLLTAAVGEGFQTDNPNLHP